MLKSTVKTIAEAMKSVLTTGAVYINNVIEFVT